MEKNITFDDYQLKPYIKKALLKIGFHNPTLIQTKSIARALAGESLVVESATGSGKTHAFLIPIFQNLDESLDNVQTVIISPTRELATQLYNVAMEIAEESSIEINIMKAIGGSDREREVKKLTKSQPQIVIGTIGRLMDLVITANVLKIHNAKTMVIDEADMIFEQKEILEVDKLISKVQGQPQFLIYSATIPKGLQHFLDKYLDEIKTITVKEANLTTSNIDHLMIQCKAKSKDEILLALMKIINPYLALIFVNTKEDVERLALMIAENGYKIGKIHGDLDDRNRKQVLKRINNLEYKYVVASDIASRGLDIEGVSHVINYDLPKDIEFYIHRTGRTARFTNKGIAYSLYAYEDDQYIKNLQAKGLKPQFVKIGDNELIPVKFVSHKPKTMTQKIENKIHQETPMPKKVKPGYKKKRKELIEKKIKQEKKSQINEMYRKKARERAKNEDR